MRKTKWYVISGPPSSGKTTIINELKSIGYDVIEDIARIIIEGEMEKGSDKYEAHKSIQEEILSRKLYTLKNTDPDKITFLDYGIVESFYYFDKEGITVPEYMRKKSKQIKFNKIFILETLPFFEQDGVRVDDYKKSIKIKNRYIEEYVKLGYNPIIVPIESVENRLKIILGELDN